MGENLANSGFPERRTNLESSFDYMITEFSKAYPNAEIIVLYPNGVMTEVRNALQNVCNNHNLKDYNFSYIKYILINSKLQNIYWV